MSDKESRTTNFDHSGEPMRRLATVVLDSNDAVTVQDLNGNIQAWNKGAERMYGHTEAEALRMNIKTIASKELQKEQARLLMKIKTGETVESFETQRRTKDGRVLDVWLTITALRDDQGDVNGIATTERDITALKQAQVQKTIAETLQKAILTVPNERKGVAFGALYEPATTELGEVGGDFYEFFELDENHICIIVGDVSGKGLNAARIVALIKNAIIAYIYEERSPAAVLEKTNKLARQRTAADLFTTVFLGILNISSGALSYCGAGHPPPIHIRTKAAPSLLITENPVVGIFEEPEYRDREAKLDPGDILIVYTDGLIEARRGPELFGDVRLLKLAEELRSIPASALPRTVHERVLAFTGGELQDDIIVLAVSRKRTAAGST